MENTSIFAKVEEKKGYKNLFIKKQLMLGEKYRVWGKGIEETFKLRDIKRLGVKRYYLKD